MHAHNLSAVKLNLVKNAEIGFSVRIILVPTCEVTILVYKAFKSIFHNSALYPISLHIHFLSPIL